MDIEFSGGQSALRNSGAMALLSPFKNSPRGGYLMRWPWGGKTEKRQAIGRRIFSDAIGGSAIKSLDQAALR